MVPVRPGQELDLAIEALVGGGEALARLDGFPVFVPGGVPGDRLRARVVSTKPGYARAIVQAILVPSPARTTPPCPDFQACGGCQWQDLSYPAQLDWKRRIVIEALERLGGLQAAECVSGTLGMDTPWHYRNKVHWAIAPGRRGPVIGLYEPRSHRVVPVRDCQIQLAIHGQVLNFLRETLPALPLPTYDERSGRGWLRSAFARVGEHTGELMVGLVTTDDRFPGRDAWIAAARERLPGLTSLVQNLQPRPGNLLMGPDTRVLWGASTIRERLGPLTLDVSARSFFQVNSRQVEALYDEALRHLDLSPGAHLVDAFCGTGTIGLYAAARSGARVTGIEVVPEAVRDAEANARRHDIRTARFIEGRVEDVLPRMLESGDRPDALILDPPRKGCEPDALEAIARWGPDRLVYVSCNPATLARDLKRLAASGYALTAARPVDMFPQSSHIEVVARLDRKSPE
ncbi:MAG: 23S rRNA (uracil(1939)-C(5))-methyltransferase RlmD [bacterium]|nr:23S rRNA (uracil(1939)-C(5))-methyltransferase RlmD [bacterium]